MTVRPILLESGTVGHFVSSSALQAGDPVLLSLNTTSTARTIVTLNTFPGQLRHVQHWESRALRPNYWAIMDAIGNLEGAILSFSTPPDSVLAAMTTTGEWRHIPRTTSFELIEPI